MSWAPILDDATRAEALRAAIEITDAVSARVETNPNVAGGAAGQALLLAKLARVTGDDRYRHAARERIELAVDLMNAQTTDLALFSGPLGIGWACDHLRAFSLIDDDEDPSLELDERVLQSLADSSADALPYDLVSGVVGIGVYAMGRPSPRRRRILAEVVRRLEELSERTLVGICWLTRAEHQSPLLEDGSRNVGLAHGIAGVIALLSDIVIGGEAAERARALLTAAVEWLLSERVDDERGAFPAVATRPRAPAARLAWCYGDAGVSVALLKAAHALSSDALRATAIDVALRGCERPLDRTGVSDAGICHGAAGLSLIYGRLFHSCRNPLFAARSSYWAQRTLATFSELSRANASVFPASPMDGSPDASLLQGATGGALALIAASTDVEPTWDRLLLTSLPVEG